MKKLEPKFNFDYKKFEKNIVSFVVHRASFLLLVIGLLFLSYCVYLWHQNIYDYSWDEIRKQEYMNNKNAGTSLNRVKFEKVLKDIERRKEEWEKGFDDAKDIFRMNNEPLPKKDDEAEKPVDGNNGSENQ